MLERIRRFGPIGFADYVDLALYDPDGGFYSTGGAAGRRADFLTSPEVGPIFAKVVARALDGWWQELGRPDPFVVVEAGAGRGTLARDLLRAGPECAPALRYVLVERSPALRAAQAGAVPLEPPAWVLGPVGPGDEGDGAVPAPGTGPVATSLAELPAGRFTGVVLANELLDNLAPRLLERGEDSWHEVGVGARGGELAEVVVPARADVVAQAERLAPDAPVGGRAPLQHQAVDWLRRALALVERGRVVALDYADVTPSLARRPWRDWLRTYRGHGPGGHPLEAPGTQDITCEVAADQLAAVRAPACDRPQVEFLGAHGLGELADAARETWWARAAVGDLEAVRARSTVTEAATLSDPTGLGAHRVLEWVVG